MPRHQKILDNLDDSDTSSSSGDDAVFNIDKPESDLESEATSVKDLDVDNDHDLEINLEDQIQLFSKNIHLPEYY
ncbi:hypothetical protein B7463_g3817, partial [Scytalidium lignicola]